MEFKNLFNKKESPEKVHAKIENLEDQIHKEKMKLLNNEERIKAEMEYVGGIDGLNKKIEKQKKEQKDWMIKAARNISITTMMYVIFNNTDDASAGLKSLEVFAMAINGFNGIDASVAAIEEWWEVKKSKMLKEEVEAATA